MKFWVHKVKDKRARRYFLHLWTKDDKRIFDGQLEMTFYKKSLSFRLHFGNRGSETPFDGHICIPFLQVYWGMDFKGLGRICEVVGFGKKRDLSLAVHSGKLWWKVWFDDDMGYDRYHNCDNRRTMWWWPFSWYREKYRSWSCLRDGNIDLNPISAIWGGRYYEYEDVDTVAVWVKIDQFMLDEYWVQLTLQNTTQRRRHGFWPFNRVTERGQSVKWWCEKGIPTRNHDWKGDETISSSVRLDPEYAPEDWAVTATYALVEQIKDTRKRYNYQPPQVEA